MAEGPYTYTEGRVPFGYCVVKQDGIPVRVKLPEEQVTVVRIKELRDAGKSLKEIARTLEAEGRKPRKASKWGVTSIGLILGRAHR
jgi:hypothetical protein